MQNPFDEMRSAVQAAKDTLRAVDQQADAMAGLLAGRLRHVNRDTLAQLKRELQGFNASTKKWAKS